MERKEFTYTVKNFVINLFGNLFFVSVGIFLSFSVDFSTLKNFKFSDFIIPLVSVVFIYCYGKKILIEVINFKKKIVFTNIGLEYDQRIYEWNTISKQKVISKKVYENKVEIDTFFISFDYRLEKIEINIDNYNTTSDEISALLKKSNIHSSIKQSNQDKTFADFIGYEDYFELDEHESKKETEKTIKICSDNTSKLKQFCKENLLTESDKINFIYYCLSDDPIKWDPFLTAEFLRVYQIALSNNNFTDLFPLLENITVEDISTADAEKIRVELFNQIDSKNLLVRLKTIQLLEYWVDSDVLNSNKSLISKLKTKLNDENWKVRWNAHSILKANEIVVEDLRILDKIKARYLNQFDI